MRSWLLAFAAAICLTAHAAGSQHATAELRGVVFDAQDAVLPGVHLTVRDLQTGTFRQTTSNEDGTYFVGGLAPGTYEIRASMPGFKPYAQPGLLLEVGRTTTVDVTLEIGSLDESVTVEAATPMLDTTSKEIGGHITSRELVELPSINRNFVGFISLLPGIVPIPSEAFGADAVSVNGIDPRSNNYMVDGANNNDDFIGQRAGTQARTPIEAIQEFQVLTHQYDAEFGRATGAVVNAVTKHGTNAFHGSAFAFFQDDTLTARDVFASRSDGPAPNTDEQQYGATLGGPVLRNRAHFFASVERVRLDRAATVNIPSRPELNTTTMTEGRIWNTVVRFDQQLSAANIWNLRWLRESSPQANLLVPAAGRQPTLDAAREESDVDSSTVAALQSVLGNSRLNTLRVAFAREDVAFANPGFNANGRRQSLLAPTLQYPTFIDGQSDVAQARMNNAYSIDDTFSWFLPGRRGSHDVKLGVQYQFATADSTNQSTLNGLFEFHSSTPFNAADPATYPERLQIRVPGASDLYMKGHFASAFAQDKWRIGERLTVNLGLRYDIESIPLREDDNPAFEDSSRYPVDKDNIAPRVGAAYSLDGANRSVFRAGYGLFYDKTAFELIAPIVTSGTYSDSFIALFPANGADPGPSRGALPSEPLLRNGPTVDAGLVASLFPPGARARNMGTVFADNPERRISRAQQMTAGYQRQIGASVAASVDYIHSIGRELPVMQDLNPGLRADTSRTGPVTRVNAEYTASVLQPVNAGRANYDALELLVDKRFSRQFAAKVSYTLSYSRGNTSGNGSPQIPVQRLDDLRLDANEGPADFDRRHNFVVSGTARVPRTGGLTISAIARALSGQPFSIIDSTTDADRNGILFDFVPAGRYAGTGENAIGVEYNGKRNGAYGPAFFQFDVRMGYQLRVGHERTLDLFGEVFNVTNRANFDNPTTAVLSHPAADRRLTDFLVLRMLRQGAVPRTGQIGIRFGF